MIALIEFICLVVPETYIDDKCRTRVYKPASIVKRRYT